VNDEAIERRTAERFLHRYYAQVVEPASRNAAWDMLTPAFQTSDTVKNRKKYYEYWRMVKQVRVGPVHHVPGEHNRFLTKLTYVLHDGRESRPEKTAFTLVCLPLISKVPLYNCEQEYLRIHDATNPDSLARLFYSVLSPGSIRPVRRSCGHGRAHGL
jgi:hypothetical protein